jgi:molybdopterin-binding protein
MKLSARNVLKGKITKVTRGSTTAHVLIDVGGATITAAITNEAADDLKLKEGMEASAIIKSSDVIVGVA